MKSSLPTDPARDIHASRTRFIEMSKPVRTKYANACKTCGRDSNRTINYQCTDCYLSTHLPSVITDEPWVWAHHFEPPSQRRRREQPDDETVALGRAIVDERSEVSKDGTSLSLLLENGKYDVPLTVDAIDELAKRTGILVGKWLVYRSRTEIDDAWLKVARATFDKTLGRGAKVSTVEENKEKRHVICVYTRNYLDLEDVGRVRGLLREMGFTEKLCYKPDIYTYINVYSGTTKLSPCRYRE